MWSALADPRWPACPDVWPAAPRLRRRWRSRSPAMPRSGGRSCGHEPGPAPALARQACPAGRPESRRRIDADAVPGKRCGHGQEHLRGSGGIGYAHGRRAIPGLWRGRSTAHASEASSSMNSATPPRLTQRSHQVLCLSHVATPALHFRTIHHALRCYPRSTRRDETCVAYC